jgi:hypothetical protein
MRDEPSGFFGRVSVKASHVVLQKGSRPIPYDPTLHADRRRSTFVEFQITPIDPTRGLITRDTVHFAREFREVIRPSIEALVPQMCAITGQSEDDPNFMPLKALDELWVSGQYVPRPENDEGETWTTLHFDAVYPDKAACEVAYREWLENRPEQTVAPPPPQAEQPAPETSEQERQTLKPLLAMMWTQAQAGGGTEDEQRERYFTSVEESPPLKPYFNRDSPEVLEVLLPPEL